jgi:hypothetical protein
MSTVTVNQDQRLYVIPSAGGGFTCLGFDVAERRRRAVTEWVGRPVEDVEVGTPAAYVAYESAMSVGAEHARRTGGRCGAALTPELDRWVGWRVEVRSADGSKRRFNVGRSTGWMPCNLEIHNIRSSGGPAAYLDAGDTVTPIRKVR